jgi:hypothetical protein
VDPRYAEQIMAEAFAGEDLPAATLQRKGPATESGEPVAESLPGPAVEAEK